MCGVAAFGFALAIATIADAPAQSTRLVDLAPQREARVQLEWEPVTMRADRDLHRMSARIADVEYLLDAGRFVGRFARIHYVVPLAPGLSAPQGLLLRWTARGALRSGEARAGERVVVFEGRIVEARLQSWFDLAIEVDSRYFDGRLVINPHFEIDVQ